MHLQSFFIVEIKLFENKILKTSSYIKDENINLRTQNSLWT